MAIEEMKKPRLRYVNLKLLRSCGNETAYENLNTQIFVVFFFNFNTMPLALFLFKTE